MKKKFVLLLACLMVFALVLTGCGSKGIVGTTWKLDRGEASGITLNVDTLKGAIGDMADMSITFTDEKNCEVVSAGNTGRATYTLDDDKLVIFDVNSYLEGTMDGNEFSIDVSGIKLIFKKN